MPACMISGGHSRPYYIPTTRRRATEGRPTLENSIHTIMSLTRGLYMNVTSLQSVAMRTKKTVSAVTAVVLLGALSCMPAACGTTRMTWSLSSNSSALCNDFTRAGYFLRRNLTSDDWVIFLESGSPCFSNGTCNRLPNIGERFNDPDSPSFGNFDPIDIVSPLTSSMECFRNRSDYFPGGDFSLLGTDILDQDKDTNPLFWSYNHVVIPYCSSDVWLGNEMNDTRNNTAADGECDCFDFGKSSPSPAAGGHCFTV